MPNLATLESCRVLPVITPRDVDSTVLLAAALQRGGMPAVEVTLRTDAALESIRAIRRELPALVVAAGTVTGERELQLAVDAGAQLAVSPGTTPALLAAARDAGVDLLPGIATASELMLGMELGYDCFKLFPAEASGGIALLKSFAGPFPGVKFCPTGGLNPNNFLSYLELPNVICCGGSWMATAELVENADWQQIEHLAAEAMGAPAHRRA